MLSAAWELRTRRTATGAQFAPADVCRDFVGTVRRLVRADWLRATADITDLPGHADDTTIHTATIDGVAVALAEAVWPFCAATGSALNVGKRYSPAEAIL
ncbi:MAG: hypothetical protein J3K34DRAFT_473292 [Monoraphidium minutum]|nr:MAG: hypothetical protein J3K34DRAFT_473292 [Monoraphidium minutum]